MTFHGRYKSSSANCKKEFFTVGHEEIDFPAAVAYTCDLCNSLHGFGFAETLQVDTPSIRRQFDAYCKTQHIEQDVALPQKPAGRRGRKRGG